MGMLMSEEVGLAAAAVVVVIVVKQPVQFLGKRRTAENTHTSTRACKNKARSYKPA